MSLRTPTMSPIEALVAALRPRAVGWRHGQIPPFVEEYAVPPDLRADPHMPMVTDESLAANERAAQRRMRLFLMGARDPADTGGTI